MSLEYLNADPKSAVEAGVSPKNKASVGVVKTVGMRREGKRRSCTFENGNWSDLDFYSIVTTDVGIRSFRPSIKTALREIL